MGSWSRRIVPVVAVVAVSICAWASPAHAASGPVPLDDGSVAPTGNYDPAVASNGTNTLVVWQRRRGDGGKGDIYGRLVSSENSAAAPTTTRISLTTLNELAPDVAWNGSSWLVVWEVGVSSGHTEIRGQRVKADGTLVGAEIKIATGTGYNENPAVTGGPNGQFFVVWEDDRNHSTTLGDIYGRRISSSGGLMDATNVRLSDDTSDFATADDVLPDVVWNGTAFVAVWEADYADPSLQSDIWADAWVPGQFSTPLLGEISSHPATEPSIASAGKTLLVVYTYEGPNSIDKDIQATRIDASTETNWQYSILGFVVARADGDQDAPAVAYNGQFLAEWQDRRDGTGALWSARIKPDGTVLDPDGIPDISNDGENLSPALTNGTKAARTYTLAFLSAGSGINSYAVTTAAK